MRGRRIRSKNEPNEAEGKSIISALGIVAINFDVATYRSRLSDGGDRNQFHCADADDEDE
jgi:hypothetical protein